MSMSSLMSKIPPVVKAVAEHALRAGIFAVVGSYASGNVIFDTTNLHTWGQAGSIFLGAFVVSALASFGISAVTGTGPALNKAESFPARRTPRRRQRTRKHP